MSRPSKRDHMSVKELREENWQGSCDICYHIEVAFDDAMSHLEEAEARIRELQDRLQDMIHEAIEEHA